MQEGFSLIEVLNSVQRQVLDRKIIDFSKIEIPILARNRSSFRSKRDRN